MSNESEENGVITSLGSNNAKFFIELTLNHPRTPNFVRTLSVGQCKLYANRIHLLKSALGCNKMMVEDIGYEVTGDGHMHAHVLLVSNEVGHHFPVGVVADIAKAWLAMMPKKHDKYMSCSLYKDYLRYRSPSIVVQYKPFTDTDEFERFKEYINKYKSDLKISDYGSYIDATSRECSESSAED